MSYYVTNENSFLDIKNAHLRVTGNVHTDVLKVGSIGFQPTGSNIPGTINFTNVTTGVTTSSNLDVGGTLNLGTVELSASTHTLDHITARGNVTSTTVQFDNATTGLVTTANVEVGGELTVTGNVSDLNVVSNVNMLHTSNTASIKLNSNVVTEFPRSKKFMKFPRVALTSASQGGYVVGRSTTYQNNAATEAWKMFDEDASTYWHSENSTGYWNADGTYDGSSELITGHLGEFVTLQLPANEKVQLHRIHVFPRGLRGQSSSWSAGAAPKDVVVIGSDNGSSWNVIATTTLTNYSFGINPQISTPVGEEFIPATFDFQTNKYYRHVGLIIKSLYHGGHVHAGVTSLEFFGTPEYDPEAHGTDVTIKSYPNVPNTDWLKVYYDGQDYSDMPTVGIASVTDKAGGDQTGTPGIGVGFDTTYKAFTFNGATTASISGTHGLGTGSIGAHSMSYWLKRTSQVDAYEYHAMIGTGGNTAGQTAIGINLDKILISHNGGTMTSVNTVITDNTWIHVAVNYNGGTTNLPENHNLYINGIEQSLIGSGSGGNFSLVGNELTLGRFRDGGNGITGSIANFRLFNRALTSDDIYQLYAYQKEDFGHGDLSMTLKAGRLGIGTSEPKAALDVRGEAKFGSVSSESGVPIIYDTGSWTSGTSIELGTIQWEKYKYHRITCRFFGTDAPSGKSGWFNVRIRGKKVGQSAYSGINTYESFASAIKKTSSTTLTNIDNGNDGPLAIYRSDPKTVNNGDCFLIINIANTLNGRQQVQFTSSYTWATVGYVQVIGGFHNYNNGGASYEKIKLLFEQYSSTSTVGSSSGDWTITGYT